MESIPPFQVRAQVKQYVFQILPQEQTIWNMMAWSLSVHFRCANWMWTAEDRCTRQSSRILLGRHPIGRGTCIRPASEWNGMYFVSILSTNLTTNSYFIGYMNKSQTPNFPCCQQGLWLGIVCGSLTKLLLLMWIVLSINWENEVRTCNLYITIHFSLDNNTWCIFLFFVF